MIKCTANPADRPKVTSVSEIVPKSTYSPTGMAKGKLQELHDALMDGSMKPEVVLRNLPKLDTESDIATKLTNNIILKRIIIKIVQSLGSKDTKVEENKIQTPAPGSIFN